MASWTLRESLLTPDILVVQLPSTRGELVRALCDDAALRSALTDSLRRAPFAAFAWELPPFAPGTLGRPAEFVVIEHLALARAVPDHSPFDEALGATTPIATFPNLGGDAVLVVPHPVTAPDSTHLAEFVRSASPSVADALWTAVGRAIAGRVASSPLPLWVSTAGLGVSWLHVRLDQRPKYYRHRPYARPDV
jgi:hypothetical protein